MQRNLNKSNKNQDKNKNKNESQDKKKEGCLQYVALSVSISVFFVGHLLLRY